MCTRPDRHSVSTSARALKDALAAMLSALGALLLALLSAPVRFVRNRRARQVLPAPATHVDVQVHLEDARCVAELKRVIRQTLRRAARTWAPLPLPVHRVVVGVGYPSAGRVDLYDDFLPSHPRAAGVADGAAGRLVVVSLGLRDGERELEPAEVAGALAAQIQAVIDDRYRQRRTVATATPAPPPAAATASPTVGSQASRLASRAPIAAASAPSASSTGQPVPNGDGSGLADPSVPRLQELLATVQQGQPLDAVGPSRNHTNP